MRKELWTILALALLTGVLSGCAETPEEPIVLQKDQEQLIATANSLENPDITISEQVNTPQRVEEHFSDNSGVMTVTINAAPGLPEAGCAKIIRGSQHEFTQEEVDLWTQTLFGDAPLYTTESLTAKTKGELEAEILLYEKALAMMEGSGTDETFSFGEDEEMETVFTYSRSGNLRQAIGNCRIQLEKAPEERVLEEAGNQLPSASDETGQWMQFSTWNEEETRVRTFCLSLWPGDYELSYYEGDRSTQGAIPNCSAYSYISAVYEEDHYLSRALKEEPEPELTEEEAAESARQLLDGLGYNSLRLSSAEQAILYSSMLSILTDEPEGGCTKGWLLKFDRCMDGIPLSPTPYMYCAVPEEAAPWFYERAEIFLSDEGVGLIHLYEPYDLGETLCGNCKLLDFDAVMEIARKMLPIAFEDKIRKETVSFDVLIDSIQFGYTRITEENRAFSGLLVPTWSFYGSSTSTVREADGTLFTSPIILYYILIILCERYVPGIYVLYPREWLNPSHLWVLGDWGVVLLLGELCLLFGGWFLLLGRRRLERL